MSINHLGIVGCGLTGVVTAMLLKQNLPSLNIVILEKSRGIGGRMCTSRNSKGIGVDLGAQFITKTKNISNFQERCYEQLLEDGLLEPLQESIAGLKTTASTANHFICPKGSGSLVKYFLNKSGCKTLFNHKVVKVNLLNEKWFLHCDNGTQHEFEAVIFTLPVPQILELDGLQNDFQESLEKLKFVEYSSRFALGLFYDEPFEYFESAPYCAKFISDDPVIRYISFDNRKRNDGKTLSVAIHTTKEYGEEHLNVDPSIVQQEILSRLEKLFPQMPKASEIKFHKWKYSQVVKNFEENDYHEISRKPSLICGGDGFTFSTFEGCILSAEKINKCILNNINK